MPRSYQESTPGVDPRSQGVIPRRFKRKKFFVTHGRTDEGWTDRRDSRNSVVDSYQILTPKIEFYAKFWLIYNTISTITSVCPSVRPSGVRHKKFFSLKSPWNHSLTSGVDPRG